MTRHLPGRCGFAGRMQIASVALGLLVFPFAGTTVLAQAPGPGTVLQQTRVPPAPLQVTGGAIELSAPAAEAIQSDILIPVERLVIEGNDLISTAALEALVKPAEGHELTLTALNGYVDRISAAYHEAGYLVAYAYLPAQTIRNGVIRIAVVEPRYDQITVTGTSRFDAGQAQRTAGVKSGDPIAEAPLARGLILLSQTPGVQIKGTLVPGTQPETSTLQLERTDLPLVSGSVTLTNYGNRFTGQALASTIVTANNPFGYGSSLSANAAMSEGDGLRSGGLSFVSPDLGNGLRFAAYGSITDYTLGGAFAALDQSGHVTQVGVDLSYPLVLTPDQIVMLRVGAQHNELSEKTGSTGATADQTIPLLQVNIDGAFKDPNGQTSAGLTLTHGDLSIGPAAAATADAAGPNAAGRFNVMQMRLGRHQYLPGGFTFNADLTGQIASKNLDSSQKFYLGGPYGVMSLPVGDANGDKGYVLRMRLSHLIAAPALPGLLSASLLAQQGKVWTNQRSYAGFAGPSTTSAAAAGFGLDYTSANWNLNAAVVRGFAASGNVSNDTRVWLSAGISF